MPALLTIGEVARCAGVRASAIRYYEEAGLLPEPECIGGKRRYEEGILGCLALFGGRQACRIHSRRDPHSPAWLSRWDQGSVTLAGSRFGEAG